MSTETLLLVDIAILFVVVVVLVMKNTELRNKITEKSEPLHFDSFSYRKIEKRLKDDMLFRVYDENGNEWTKTRLSQWIENKGTGLVYANLDGFYINQEGELYLFDNSGNSMLAEGLDFNILWNEDAI